jgi:TolB-like protein/DNA-binding winged helix-turn-helix (wHTH) protein/Tfp pilus assembly protein PilF
LENDFLIGAWLVQPSLNSVSRNGSTVRLESKVMGVLLCLARHAGTPLSKDQLLKAVWPDTFVTEDALKRCISELRRVFEDDAREPQVIETIPKLGYRLIAPVTADTESLSARALVPGMAPTTSKWWKLALAIGISAVVLIVGGRAVQSSKKKGAIVPPGKIRLVVLPFQNLSGDTSQDFFSAGLTDELTTQLGRLDPLRLGVIASTSSNLMPGKSIPEVARILNVQYVLEGSVRRSANQVRIDVQLIQANDETHIWASSYTRDLTDILKVQTEVSDAVARQLPANLHIAAPSPPPSVRPQAHDAYLKGKLYLDSRTDLDKSLTSFEEAVHEDSNYAMAYAGLSYAYILLGEAPSNVIVPIEARRRGREAAQRALEIDPSLAQAHAALGIAAFDYDWDLRTAEREYHAAMELAPNDSLIHEWLGHVYLVQGRKEEALEEGQRALELDPVSPACHAFLARIYYYYGDYDEAIERARHILDIEPQFLDARYWLGNAYLRKKMYSEAIEQFRLGLEVSGHNSVMIMAYGYAQALAGNPAEARAGLRELEAKRKKQYVPAMYSAGIYLGLGDNVQAMKYLNQAYDERSDELIFLGIDPILDPLRSDPGFKGLLQRIGLPPVTKH